MLEGGSGRESVDGEEEGNTAEGGRDQRIIPGKPDSREMSPS